MPPPPALSRAKCGYYNDEAERHRERGDGGVGVGDGDEVKLRQRRKRGKRLITEAAELLKATFRREIRGWG